MRGPTGQEMKDVVVETEVLGAAGRVRRDNGPRVFIPAQHSLKAAKSYWQQAEADSDDPAAILDR